MLNIDFFINVGQISVVIKHAAAAAADRENGILRFLLFNHVISFLYFRERQQGIQE